MTELDALSKYPAMMTIEQVYEAIQVPPRTLYAWRQAGGGPPFTRLGSGRGSTIRYSRDELRRYLARRTAARETDAVGAVAS